MTADRSPISRPNVPMTVSRQAELVSYAVATVLGLAVGGSLVALWWLR